MSFNIVESPIAGSGNLRYAVCKDTGIIEAEERRFGEQNAYAEDPVMRRDLNLPEAVQFAESMGRDNMESLLILGYDARIDDPDYQGRR